MTPLVLAALLAAAPAQPPAPSPDPKPVPATRAEIKTAMEGHKTARPRLPFPPGEADGPLAKVNNGRFRAYYLPAEFGGGGGGGAGAAGGRGAAGTPAPG